LKKALEVIVPSDSIHSCAVIPVSRFSFFDSGMKGNYPSDSNHRRDKNWWVFLKKQLTVNVRRNKQRDVPKSNLFSKKQEDTVPLEFLFRESSDTN
jgi:hypothetical protein